jgi:glycogen debranching enzyme
MAVMFGEPELSARYEKLAARLKETINRNMWIEEEGLYADAMGTPAHVLQRVDLYIARERERGSERTAAELEQMKVKMSRLEPDVQRPWLFKNWVINTPMEVGLAPREQAVRALDRMGTDEFTGPWGTYLSGMNRTHMMTISTGVQAVAECSYDRTDEALRYVRLIASTFSKRLPGSISEMSPDYGCFVQAWTNYGMVWPLMTHMFGIRPDAYRRELTLRPRPPSDWNRLSVEGVRLGTGECANALDWSIMRGECEDVYRFSLLREGWSVRLNVAVPAGATIKVDDAPADPVVEADGSLTIVIPQASIHEIRVVKA